jgi:hypothetical protein
VLLGFPWGILGIALALAALAFFIKLPVQIWYACRHGPVRQADVYSMLAPLLASGTAGLCAVLAARWAWPVAHPAAVIGIAAAVLAVTMLTVLMLTTSGRRMLLDLVQGAEMLLRRRGKA